MTLTLPRGPKMIEAICPGYFKSFTKIGSMHRHNYEDRCRKPIPRFVKKIKAQHDARVAAAAARSAAHAGARAALPPRDQNITHQIQGKTQLCPVPSLCDCGLAFPRETDLELHSNSGYCGLKQQQTQFQDFVLGDLAIDTNWMVFPSPWAGWPQLG